MVLATCVRCQLRHIPFPAHLAVTVTATELICPSRAYSTDHGYKWKHIRRVVGTGRRRQRVDSVDLERMSMEKPASVIVLHDVHEPVQPSSTRALGANDPNHQPHQAPSALEIENAITGHHPAPEEAEVNKSIHHMRPETTLLDQAGFKGLRKRLTQGYTSAQLSRYLRASLSPQRSVESKHSQKVLQVSPWQSERTPLNVRRGTVVRPTATGRKQRTADRIMRLVWRITVDTEEQEVGELELMVQPWQLSMLFDLARRGRPYYKSFIVPRLLIDATIVEHYRPDCAIRITGRRHDAEQVAYQLEVALLDVQQLDLDLAMFATKSPKNPFAPDNDFCTDEDLSRVSKLTTSVISSRGRSSITIYNRTTDGANYARRLILSLLELSSTSDIVSTLAPTMGLTSEPENSPILARVAALASGLHSQWKDRDLARQVRERERILPNLTTTVKEVESTSLDITAYLRSLDLGPESLLPGDTLSGGYWQQGALSSGVWQADFVKILQEYSGSPSSHAEAQQSKHVKTDSPSKQSVIQRHLPAVESALSYFTTYRPPKAVLAKDAFGDSTFVNRQAPRLIAHLVPVLDAHEGRQNLPRLELRFQFAATKQRELSLTGMRLMLGAQTVNVPVPTEAVDLSFTRRRSMVANIDSARQDSKISAFADAVRRSARATNGTITAPPELIIHIPSWLLVDSSNQQSSTAQDVPVTYLLERFEQTHKKIFIAPNDTSHELEPVVQSVMDSMGTGLRLEYKEVEGGPIHGSNSTLSVRHHIAGNTPAAVGSRSEVGSENGEHSTHQIATAAVTVARLLTAAASAALPLRKLGYSSQT